MMIHKTVLGSRKVDNLGIYLFGSQTFNIIIRESKYFNLFPEYLTNITSHHFFFKLMNLHSKCNLFQNFQTSKDIRMNYIIFILQKKDNASSNSPKEEKS